VFVISFAIVGIKWLNHHRMFARIRRADILPPPRSQG